MEYRKIGSLNVSLAGLGCNNFGWRIDAAATQTVVDAAIDAGINFFDTADVYGAGQSEEYLGKALKGRRDKVIIATKFGMKMGHGMEGARPHYIEQALDDSLRRLGVDYIDLYQLHWPDRSLPLFGAGGTLYRRPSRREETPIEETLAALDALVGVPALRVPADDGAPRPNGGVVPRGEIEFREVAFAYGSQGDAVLKDVSFRIVPLTRRDAREMIKELKGYPILGGYRGQEPANIEVLRERLSGLNVSRKEWHARNHGIGHFHLGFQHRIRVVRKLP